MHPWVTCISSTNEQCSWRGQQEHYILENFYWTKLLDFSLELLFLNLEEKRIELCPGYDMFFFPPPSFHKYRGLGKVVSSGFWNSFPTQFFFSELFSFISPTYDVGYILIFPGLKVCLEGGSRYLQASQVERKLFSVMHFTAGIWEFTSLFHAWFLCVLCIYHVYF